MESFDATRNSLTYLINPLYQNALAKQKKNTASNKSDIIFYQKRIMDMTNDMLNGNIPHNNYINTAFNEYVNDLIKYFKTLDSSEIIQQKYINTPIIEPIIDSDKILANDVKAVDVDAIKVDAINNLPTYAVDIQ